MFSTWLSAEHFKVRGVIYALTQTNLFAKVSTLTAIIR